jgi:TIR domain
MKKIFISYSRSDSAAVTHLVGQLTAGEYRVWHDSTIAGGQHWWARILAEIRECDLFLFALSRASVDSEACRRELDYAYALGKPLIPVRVQDDINPQALSRPLAEIQVIDYLKPAADLMRVVGAINLTPAGSPLPLSLPEAPELPVSYLAGLNDRVQSIEKLSDDQQKALCTDLRIALDEGHNTAEIRKAIERFLRRPELLASVKAQLDVLNAAILARESPRVSKGYSQRPVESAQSAPKPSPNVSGHDQVQPLKGRSVIAELVAEIREAIERFLGRPELLASGKAQADVTNGYSQRHDEFAQSVSNPPPNVSGHHRLQPWTGPRVIAALGTVLFGLLLAGGTGVSVEKVLGIGTALGGFLVLAGIVGFVAVPLYSPRLLPIPVMASRHKWLSAYVKVAILFGAVTTFVPDAAGDGWLTAGMACFWGACVWWYWRESYGRAPIP